jgi:CRP/FNR family transcriptional regulator, anaerobic regulatory protein
MPNLPACSFPARCCARLRNDQRRAGVGWRERFDSGLKISVDVSNELSKIPTRRVFCSVLSVACSGFFGGVVSFQLHDQSARAQAHKLPKVAAPNCAECPVSKFGIYAPTYKAWPDRIFHRRLGATTYGPNQSILRQEQASDRLGSIRSGWAYSYLALADGRRHIQGLLLPGDTIALDLLLIGSHPVSFGVKALTETIVCWFPLEFMKRMAHERADQRQETEKWISYYFLVRNRRTASLNLSNAIGSVAEFILELGGRARHRGLMKDDTMEFPPTQSIIADCLGLTPIHVNRVLAQFRKQSILEIKDRTLRIFDEKELTRISHEGR